MKTSVTDDLTDIANALPWDELETFAKGKYEKVSNTTYRFVLKKSNHGQLLKSALKTLQKNDPDNATPEGAERLADMMEVFAKIALETKENRKTSK